MINQEKWIESLPGAKDKDFTNKKYNTDPIVPYKGSAIFIHIMEKNYKPTKGCIALKLQDFMEILSTLMPNDKIKILE